MTIKQSDFRAFQVRFHRNGVAGESFHLCRFLFKHCGNEWIALQAVVFDQTGRVAVTSEQMGDRWRGDQFEDALRDAIAAVERAQPETIHARA